MANMINFFELAQLAEASYASFDRLAPKDALTNRDDDLGSLMGFSDTQADLLLAEWKLVENGHQPNTASGN